MTRTLRLSGKAVRWLAGTWAAVTAVAVGAAVAPPAAVERTDPSIPVVTADLAPVTPRSAADGSGVGEEGGPVLDLTPPTTTLPPPTTTTGRTTTAKPTPPPPPAVKPAVSQAPVVPSAPLGARIVAAARTFFGVPYLWGGLSRLGLDCSGLVVLVMRAVGLNPPRTAAQQAGWTVRIPASQAQPGDLVFEGSPAYHVGVYIGGGQMIDAQDVGTVVGIHKVPSGSYYGRVPS